MNVFFILFLSLTAVAGDRGLRWQTQTSPGFTKALKSLESSLPDYFLELAKGSAPVKVETEGRLDSDPVKKVAREHLKSLDMLLNVSLCGKFSTRELSLRCKQRALPVVKDWLAKYQSDGNPINQTNLVPLLLSIDILWKDLNDSESVKLWLNSVAHSLDDYYAKLPATRQVRKNNWNSHRLMIQGLIYQILGDSHALEGLKATLQAHLIENLQMPAGWKPRKDCANIGSVSEYGGLDFQQRDAIDYHVYNLRALLTLELFVPQVFTAESQNLVKSAVQFLKPYVLKEKFHREFVCTTVEFDQTRKKAGQAAFQDKNWDPWVDRAVLRRARLVFEDTKTWTQALVSPEYSRSDKLLFTLFGD